MGFFASTMTIEAITRCRSIGNLDYVAFWRQLTLHRATIT